MCQCFLVQPVNASLLVNFRKGKMILDVVEVKIGNPSTVRVLERDKDPRNAEAIIKFAIMRRGVVGRFYSETIAGKYNDGDEWVGSGVSE